MIVVSSRNAADLKQAQEHLAGLGIKSDWIAADIRTTMRSRGWRTRQSSN